MASIRERYVRATKDRTKDYAEWRAGLEKVAALGDARAIEDLRLLNHFEARAQGDHARAPHRKAA